MPASPSKRSTRIKQSVTGGTAVRQYRCRKCLDNPLVKDCLVHGKKNRELQRRQTRVPNTSLPSPTFSESAEPGLERGTDPSVDAMDTDDANIDPRLRGLQADGTRRATSTLQTGDEGTGGRGAVTPDDILPDTQPAALPQSRAMSATNENTRQKKISLDDGDDDWEDDDEDEEEDEDMKDGVLMAQSRAS
ncbi:hypothetical protein NP233_g82 [Leucocoprinus birnbaumii]|uniref:Uncharacterized protein n=1 Tax=Leucocoprinus birnbaumii TaxID=56174 RepID=A0AAD5Z0J0_9AGAR|nr:hypothetical protein NP233_g82 [Leucocoprinus birnbaumii]